MQNYWIGIMAIAFALALVLWLTLVFRANRHPHGMGQGTSPRREVLGGSFEAREGGRQVMPDPNTPLTRLTQSGNTEEQPHDQEGQPHGHEEPPGPPEEQPGDAGSGGQARRQAQQSLRQSLPQS
ncbi:MAG TPA: hypothetical protein VNF47_20910 [Streptosporangiaceae bacterium]|nr:hypothetical protein [Streptosporangiaceae bacterium]